ncbi:MAG TPA: SDR family NAD(P)-dependent oxidoreductase [Bacteroidota bacterium]|nr:SDR family NAD(P)-dependent oxidoreductase [Bacteroidota bacterium]
MILSGKVSVISGASRGIGRALAKRFAREGSIVCLCARHTEQLRAVSLEIMAAGGKSIFEQTDVSDELQVREFLSHCAASFGSIDILVNNAGALGPRVPLADYSSQEWNRVLQVNLYGLFYMTKHALPYFNPAGGSIINVSSSVGKVARANWGAYGVSKFATEGYTQAIAEELRPRNIRVNAVNPGAVATEMRHLAFPDEDQRTLRKPEDILDIFLYLASDESKQVTGKSLDAQHFKKG